MAMASPMARWRACQCAESQPVQSGGDPGKNFNAIIKEEPDLFYNLHKACAHEIARLLKFTREDAVSTFFYKVLTSPRPDSLKLNVGHQTIDVKGLLTGQKVTIGSEFQNQEYEYMDYPRMDPGSDSGTIDLRLRAAGVWWFCASQKALPVSFSLTDQRIKSCFDGCKDAGTAKDAWTVFSPSLNIQAPCDLPLEAPYDVNLVNQNVFSASMALQDMRIARVRLDVIQSFEQFETDFIAAMQLCVKTKALQDVFRSLLRLGPESDSRNANTCIGALRNGSNDPNEFTNVHESLKALTEYLEILQNLQADAEKAQVDFQKDFQPLLGVIAAEKSSAVENGPASRALTTVMKILNVRAQEAEPPMSVDTINDMPLVVPKIQPSMIVEDFHLSQWHATRDNLAKKRAQLQKDFCTQQPLTKFCWFNAGHSVTKEMTIDETRAKLAERFDTLFGIPVDEGDMGQNTVARGVQEAKSVLSALPADKQVDSAKKALDLITSPSASESFTHYLLTMTPNEQTHIWNATGQKARFEEIDISKMHPAIQNAQPTIENINEYTAFMSDAKTYDKLIRRAEVGDTDNATLVFEKVRDNVLVPMIEGTNTVTPAAEQIQASARTILGQRVPPAKNEELFDALKGLLEAAYDIIDALSSVRVVVCFRETFDKEATKELSEARTAMAKRTTAKMIEGNDVSQAATDRLNNATLNTPICNVRAGPFFAVTKRSEEAMSEITSDLMRLWKKMVPTPKSPDKSPEHIHQVYAAYGLSGAGKTHVLLNPCERGGSASSVLQSIVNFLHGYVNNKAIDTIDVTYTDVYGETMDVEGLDGSSDKSDICRGQNERLNGRDTWESTEKYLITVKDDLSLQIGLARGGNAPPLRITRDNAGALTKLPGAVQAYTTRKLFNNLRNKSGGETHHRFHVRATPNNKESSRCHAVLTFWVKPAERKSGMMKISLVDMAGAENVNAIQDAYYQSVVVPKIVRDKRGDLQEDLHQALNAGGNMEWASFLRLATPNPERNNFQATAMNKNPDAIRRSNLQTYDKNYQSEDKHKTRWLAARYAVDEEMAKAVYEPITEALAGLRVSKDANDKVLGPKPEAWKNLYDGMTSVRGQCANDPSAQEDMDEFSAALDDCRAVVECPPETNLIAQCLLTCLSLVNMVHQIRIVVKPSADQMVRYGDSPPLHWLGKFRWMIIAVNSFQTAKSTKHEVFQALKDTLETILLAQEATKTKSDLFTQWGKLDVKDWRSTLSKHIGSGGFLHPTKKNELISWWTETAPVAIIPIIKEAIKTLVDAMTASTPDYNRFVGITKQTTPCISRLITFVKDRKTFMMPSGRCKDVSLTEGNLAGMREWFLSVIDGSLNTSAELTSEILVQAIFVSKQVVGENELTRTAMARLHCPLRQQGNFIMNTLTNMKQFARTLVQAPADVDKEVIDPNPWLKQVLTAQGDSRESIKYNIRLTQFVAIRNDFEFEDEARSDDAESIRQQNLRTGACESLKFAHAINPVSDAKVTEDHFKCDLARQDSVSLPQLPGDTIRRRSPQQATLTRAGRAPQTRPPARR